MTNHLAKETSPYLLQHCENPVEWYPWGEEALTLARTQNKPILLSIGYSACHWCHVMAHESFEDEAVALAMNQHFINIKVDREERPDIDQIYQTVHYMLNQRNGGWPLTMFLTPEQKPFFGGTYFPKVARHGLPGFLDLLPRIAEAYYTRGEAIEQQSASLEKLLAESLPEQDVREPEFSEQMLDQVLKALAENFDSVHGGFGNAPKFIHPAELEFCLQRYFTDKNKNALHLAVFTLEKMARGGIYDQLGGGFCRYSTDPYWRIPHFEKMLYDNGSLLYLYTAAWLVTGESLFKQIVEETAAWVLREMQSPIGAKGGYYSTLDADSEHEEGKFYVWDRAQVAQILSPEEYEIVAPYYGLVQPPNFEQKLWNLEVTQSLAEVAQTVGICYEEAQQRLAAARKKLGSVREMRIHPGRDEKVLTSWNGLMIKGMAYSGRVFKQRAWRDSAIRAVDFIRNTMWKNNRLLATYKDGRAHLNAYLDDYAFLLDGLLELLQTEFRQIDLDFAVALAEVLLDQFEDQEAGGFFFTSHDHEVLIHRPKPVYDNATPSGNGVAVMVLQRLGHLLGEYRYLQAAERALRLFYPAISSHSSGCCSLLIAVEEIMTPPPMVILRGREPALSEWRYKLQNRVPHLLIFALSSELVGLPASLDKPVPVDKAVNAWVCQGVNCLPEITSLQELLHVCAVQGRITTLL
ncbi:MAG: thioredoxin domain-containing protein [Nitrosomonas sp.]|nr:thioredoxin domain-containing protein [Nitrosomonas sp.]MDP1951641.1 thioredoxin domain-containing protein [Nitrosomonas sp.]